MAGNDVKYLTGNTGVVLKWSAIVTSAVVIFSLGVWVKGIEASTKENNVDIQMVKEQIHQVEREGSSISRSNSSDIRLLQKDIDGIIKSLERNDGAHDRLMTVLEQLRTELRVSKLENNVVK